MKEIIAALGISLLTAACGGSDSPANDGGAGSNASGSGGSEAVGDAGESGAGVSSGGTTGSAGSNAAGANAAGSSAAGSNAAGGASSRDCELEPAIVSCYVEAGQGAGVCTETAVDGTSAQVVRDQCGGMLSEGEHCPTTASLAGYCKGGVTTYYYEPASTKIWTNVGTSCEATGGVWCGI